MTYPEQIQTEAKKFGALKQMLDISKEFVSFIYKNLYIKFQNSEFNITFEAA